jgi:SAM-dependent methyltransferase
MPPDSASLSQEALNARQFGETAQSYVASAVHSGGSDLAQLVTIAAQRRPKSALDLGCGGGHVSYAIAPHADRVTAYDLSPDMTSAVAVEAGRRGLANIETRQGPAESLPFADATFDAVFCRYTAHHWPDIRLGLREARRVLKPDGVAVVSDVVAPELPVLDTFLQTFEMLRDPSHVRDYSVAEWVEVATQAGFVVTGITRRPLPLEFAPWTQRQRTPEVMSSAIRALFAAVSEDVRRHFAIQPNGDFTIDQIVLELRPL